MGAWSTSVAGNDTAQDLKIEYACAFYYYDKEEALRRIEDYAARNGYTVDDPQEYCDYVYSLADFMWRNGILTDEIRDRAVKMIEDGFGLELWEEAGEKTLNSRKKALESFKQKIMSPMGKEKKIKPKAYTEKLFEAFLGGCVPIYAGGASNPEPGVVNPEAVLLWERGNKENNDAIVKKVCELNANETLYAEFLSRTKLLPYTVDYIYDTFLQLKERLEALETGRM